MPLALDPNVSVDVWLSSDEDKPLESRPVFRVKFLSGRQKIALVEAVDRAIEAENDKKVIDLLEPALSRLIVGTRNAPADALASLTLEELFELPGAIIRRTTAEEIDRKKLRRQQPSAQVPSAAAAAPQVAATLPA